jgi:uncharacterized protein (TIGR00255 family)
MIRSMTGFGEAERDTPAGRLRAELRTVNHRYFSANLKLARQVERYEPLIRDWLRSRLQRGHINFTLRLEMPDAEGGTAALRVDEARAQQYMRALKQLKQQLGLAGEIDLQLLTRFGDVLVSEDDAVAPVIDADTVREITEAAASAAVTMREEEGGRLASDLEGRLVSIEAAIVAIEERAPIRLIVERDRIRRVVNELLEGVGIEDERVAREVAFLAERWDVTEELVRLRSHIVLFRQTISADAGEPVGKRLSFLTQEMNREANTIGSKANDAPIEHAVITIKEDIERLREQVENVE